MAKLNIPSSFDTKEVGHGQFSKRENVGIGRYDLVLQNVKFKEGRGGEPFLIYEWLVDNVIDGSAHREGDELQSILNLGDDYGQVDGKVIAATLLGPLATRTPAIEETKATTGKVVESKTRWAVGGDPNAIDSDVISQMCDGEDPLHADLVGTVVNVRGYSHSYTPANGKNVGKEVTVTRYNWKLVKHMPGLADAAAAAQTEIDRMNSEFKAKLGGQQAA